MLECRYVEDNLNVDLEWRSPHAQKIHTQRRDWFISRHRVGVAHTVGVIT